MSARLAPGEVVRVRAGDPPHHMRTPGYLKGTSKNSSFSGVVDLESG